MTLPGPLPANETTGSSFTAADEVAVETAINEDTTAIAALQASELQIAFVSVSITTTLAAAANTFVFVTILSGGVPTLPTAVSATTVYFLTNASGGLVTVTPASGQTIGGQSLPTTLNNGDSMSIYPAGGNWSIF